jgi:hypothetical protein
MDGMSLRSTPFILLLKTMMTQLNFETLSTEQTGDVLNLIPDAPELTNDKHLDHAFDCIR